jgi:hypothetical protein
MADFTRTAGVAFVFACSLVATTVAASATPTGLSNLIILNPQVYEPWAVYAYDPGEGAWTQLDNVNWQESTSVGHNGLAIQATAAEATAVSTYRVVIQVMGQSLELFITPTATQLLSAGQTTTLFLNNVL